MIDKSESVNWANVWWILGADYLTLEGFMGDFREKYPVDWLREENSMQRNSWEKQYPALKKILLMTYNAKKKKSFTVICGAKNFFLQRFGKKLLPQLNHAYTPPPQTSNGHVNHLGGGGRNGFDTLVNVIHQQNGWRTFIMLCFSRVIKFCISRLKKRRWKIQREWEIQWKAQFPFCGQTKAFRYKVVFRGIQPCFCTADPSA